MAASTMSRPTAAAGRGRLPEPVRDRRPALAALALLLVLGGALASALVAYRSGDRTDVLITSRPIALGQEITRGDFRVARVASDEAVLIDATAVDNFVGTRALTAIPEGTLVNRSMFLAGSVVPGSAALIGVVLGPAQGPAAALASGDVVGVYRVGEEAVSATPLLSAVRVSDVGGADSGGNTRLSLLVPNSQVAALVAASTGGSITVVELASDTAPLVDFVRE